MFGLSDDDQHYYSIESQSFSKVNEDHYSPNLINNIKYVQYMPEGKRIVSGDLKGLSFSNANFFNYE